MCCNYDSNDNYLGFYLSLFFFFVALKPDPTICMRTFTCVYGIFGCMP